MAKEIDDKDTGDEDEKQAGVEPAEIADREPEDSQETEPPKDIRGAIKHAIKEVEDNEQDEKESEQEKETKGEKKEDNKAPGVDRKAGAKQPDDKSNVSDVKEEKEPSKSKHEPVGYWKAKGKAVWDKLDDEGRQHLLAREKEVSDGFAQVSQRLQAASELERVIAPRRSYIQKYGVSEAQTVDRLFQWMEAISHPDPAYKLNSFKGLAEQFGVDIRQLVPQARADNNSQAQEGVDAPEVQDTGPPPWFSQFASSVGEKVSSLEETIATQKRSAANAVVDSWAAAKDENGGLLRPHFETVRQLMSQLCTPIIDPQTGQIVQQAVIPLKDGRIDLDAAYDAAIKLHPEVAAQVQQAAAEKAESEAKAKAQREAKERAEKLARAKRAGSGLKPAAPSMGSALNTANRLNGSKPKDTSIRASIKAALDEVRE